MYLKIKGTKLQINECLKFKERFKSLKFYLNNIDFGLYFPRKKIASTYFFCQKVDICFTDKDNKVLYLYKNVRSEKFIFKFKSKNIYYLPVGYADRLRVGDKLNIIN